MSLVLPFSAFAIGLFPIILASYHQHLVCKNTTTNESCKNQFKDTGNPYENSSRCKTYVQIFCKSHPRRWIPEAPLMTHAKCPLDDNQGVLVDF